MLIGNVLDTSVISTIPAPAHDVDVPEDTGRRYADGGLLHADALHDECAARAREPDDPRLGSQQPVAIAAGRRAGSAPDPLTTREVRRYATLNGAKHLRLDHKTGSLTPGKEANIIILDATALNVAPLNQVPGAVVSLMDRTNVETVIVAGKVRKWQGGSSRSTTAGIERDLFRDN
jgi:hypothetical protein